MSNCAKTNLMVEYIIYALDYILNIIIFKNYLNVTRNFIISLNR